MSSSFQNAIYYVMQEINWSLPPELYKYTVLLSLEDTVNGFTDHVVSTGTVYTNSQP